MNKLISKLKIKTWSSFHTSVQRFENKDVINKALPKESTVSQDIGITYMNPSSLDKWILVFGKKFKALKDVPDKVPTNLYNHARNVARIKLANYTMVAVLIGCCYMVYSGKQAAKSGDTLLKKSLDWHEEIKKEYEQELINKSKDTK